MADRRRVTRFAIVLSSALLGLAVLEGGARVVLEFRDAQALDDAPERVPDMNLEYRIEPGTGGHDARGYRNREALERADVVALGDSQTWGENASVDDSWPAQLARATGLRVYNMGLGGYGPVHYRALLDDALLLEPDVVVVALYFGNDLYDAYHLAYELEQARWRHPDEEERASITHSDYPDLKRMFFDRLNYRRAGFAPLEWLTERAAIVRLATSSLGAVDASAHRTWAEDHPLDGFVYDFEGLSTVFHSTYRLAAVDMRLSRIREGVRITEQVLSELSRRIAKAPATQLLVVLLPTKERVFSEAIRLAETETPPSYRESVAFEQLIEGRLVEWMDDERIAWVLALPALRASIRRSERIFPPNADGHFTVAGYTVVADVVADRLAELTGDSLARERSPTHRE